MKKILITWWMSGLGLEISKYASSKWYEVDILDISTWKVDLKNIHKSINYINFDITNFNKLDIINLSVYNIIICNAWISLSWDFKELDFEKEKKVFDVNILWHMKLIKLLLQEKKILNNGRIWFTVSASEMLPFPIAIAYASSKWAMNSFARALRSYLYYQKIKVSCIYPWPMDTPHVKYYGKKPSDTDNKKVRKIAQRSFEWIIRWKRFIYPDITSKILNNIRFLSPLFDKIMYKTYQKSFKV